MRAIARERRASLASRSPRAIFGASLLTWESAALADGALSTYVDGALIDTHTDMASGLSPTASGSARLTYVASAFGGRGAARGVAGTTVASSASPVISGDAAHTLICVAQLSATGTSLGGLMSLGLSTAGTRGTSTIGVHLGAWWYGGDDSVLTAGTADTNPHVLVKTYEGAGGLATLYVDGASVGSSTPGAMSISAGHAIDSYQTLATGASADIAETMIVSGAISASQIARIGAYLKAKWGTP